MSAEVRLKELGLVLPRLPKPVANYVPYRLAGNLLFLSGQGPSENGVALTGKLGAEISLEQGKEAGQLCGLNLLAQAKRALDGDLDRFLEASLAARIAGADEAAKGERAE